MIVKRESFPSALFVAHYSILDLHMSSAVTWFCFVLYIVCQVDTSIVFSSFLYSAFHIRYSVFFLHCNHKIINNCLLYDCNPSLIYIAVRDLQKALNAMRVYNLSYWLVIFWHENSWKKTKIIQ